ncbi:MAG: pyrroline-5-carboxylate reductase dimerization domain-containing protein [Cypionkella sp.]
MTPLIEMDSLALSGFAAQAEQGDRMMIGVIGVGHLGKILVEALLAAGIPAQDLILSPRGKAMDLAARHGLRLAADTASLVEQAEVVLLVVRPKDAVEAITGLPWRKGQSLVSACAGVKVAQLAEQLPPGVAVHRIMPLTAAAQGASPTTLFPADPQIARLLAAFGPVLPLGSEAEFETATVCAAVYGWMQRLVQLTAEWSVEQGLPAPVARQLAALTTVAAGRNVADSPLPMDQLLEELVTPGGITEAGLQLLEGKGALGAWSAACDVVEARLSGR